ncbi:DUF4402 domain-containing protein [Cetobacterium sp.]|uniref:DUF4402 domain-containing protein n=1 Tax=Cetobacterium sp. TaxID=2071632 RepID=UPI003F3DD9D6
MKKLLTLLSLTLSMTAFAAPQGNSIEDKTMNITARVIAPLNIDVTHMAFGDVIKGTTATATGTYTITGEPNQAFELTISELTHLNGPNKSILPITISKTLDLVTNLDQDGKAVQILTGTLIPTESTTTGNYNGTITARVQYK